ncbi:hypothetical protein [Prescottella equi]|uniref:Uncharacterized protein n=1 Tax=Rhodococcus hoagii TaxID=43767 RepID=A0AAE5MK09_RHOHA|nr:hypothetical protein [Prescottella equi]AVP69044.1 hypothetical protein C7H75_14545 [Prescottella equi]ERN45178.1 hypothetical protein H849_14132 [Prescottella equi NBRC 101255 = C 7]MBM4485080.1 hypothetical protein [Prescottella equi]MBM4630249.1 hypothetical protein [Prescottella equi]MBM4731555.1 hypothetical protein [Prescottella equi]
MTTAALPRRSRGRSGATVDLAGTAWPLYKLEALAAGLLVFVLVLAVTQVLQPAVLTAAGVAVIVWWGRRVMLARQSTTPLR